MKNETIKEKIKRLQNEAGAEKVPSQQRAEKYFDKIANIVGGYETLAKITGVNPTTIRRWRKGSKPKFTEIIKFEIAVNDHFDYSKELEDDPSVSWWSMPFQGCGGTMIRACRWKFAPYALEDVEGIKSGYRRQDT